MMTEMFDPSVPEKVSGRLAQNEKRLAVSENVAAHQCNGRSEPTRLILATGQKRRSSIAGDRSGLGRGTPSFYGLGHSRRHGRWDRLVTTRACQPFASRRAFACHEPLRVFVGASSVRELPVLLALQTAAETDHLVPWMNACISSRVSLPSLLLSIALKIRS
jgi:hypothetical protein